MKGLSLPGNRETRPVARQGEHQVITPQQSAAFQFMRMAALRPANARLAQGLLQALKASALKAAMSTMPAAGSGATRGPQHERAKAQLELTLQAQARQRQLLRLAGRAQTRELQPSGGQMVPWSPGAAQPAEDMPQDMPEDDALAELLAQFMASNIVVEDAQPAPLETSCVIEEIVDEPAEALVSEHGAPKPAADKPPTAALPATASAPTTSDAGALALVQTEASASVPAQGPAEVPAKVPAEVPAEVPSEAPTDVPSEAPTDVQTHEPDAQEDEIAKAQQELKNKKHELTMAKLGMVQQAAEDALKDFEEKLEAAKADREFEAMMGELKKLSKAISELGSLGQ